MWTSLNGPDPLGARCDSLLSRVEVTGGRVLVVDDDVSLRQSVAQVLEDEGYTVDHAPDGVSALSRVAENRPDLILLDVLMPNMNGRQVLERLRRDQETADIPILVMTAVSGLETNQSMALGASDIVEKPFDL
ncbi:MAG: response regulator, partial [Deltaproteobacteria bacterium]|nr:response regulator [Deltaproteobacteria bacterium]